MTSTSKSCLNPVSFESDKPAEVQDGVSEELEKTGLTQTLQERRQQ